jgi:hypothetical protein
MVNRHNDMLGVLSSATGGGTAWTYASFGDTGFVMGALGSADTVQLKIQVPHTRKLGTPLDSIHMHVVNTTILTAGTTVNLVNMSYVWLRVGDAIPTSASWTTLGTGSFTYTAPVGDTPAQTYMLWSMAANIVPPPNEGYGGMILVKISRAAETTGGNLGILDVDAHSIMDRLGSINEASD